jgi:cell division septal protein FtsQ
MPFFRRKRIDLRRNREIETNVWKHVLWGVLSIIGIALCVTAVWYLTRLNFVTISTVTVQGGETIPHTAIETIVNDTLRGSYMRVIPYTFAYAYPREEIVRMLNSVPRIRDVHVARTSGTTLTVTYGEYMPHALWCMSIEEVSECYFLDKAGYAFSLAPPLRGGSLVRYVIEGTEHLEEKQILPSELFQETEKFIELLGTQLEFRVTHVTYTTDGDSIYRINGGGDFLVTTEMNVEEALNNLRAILESKEFNHIEPGNFNYIDLRFGKKVFVNEELTPATTTGTTTLSE